MNRTGKKFSRLTIFRALMFVAGVTLLGYIPYKMIVQPETMTGLYGVLFPSASVLAITGVSLGLKPSLAHKMPFALRLPMGLLAAGWLTTGLECIPTLTRSIMMHPLGGLFATMHMALQHVILSIGLGTLLMAPRATHAFLGVSTAEGEDAEPSELAADNA
ncbi:MAG TPA: hypothetical protein VLK65_06370 [Vicinamibacteria bacterium]|nr:hypothetical protein [Vicinamibacteria bacterium]